ncbi:MAG: type II toxin-antitoxin system Phd/YefM family antitoxin [Okeania sp. SIO2C9]|nr:type II toxin-antitoxin system Phd/YefM family antitoxin [Okeania sp. SIO2C9]
MTNHSLTDFEHNSKYFVQQIKETQKSIVLTVNGKAEIVIQDAIAYQKLLERLDYAESVAAIPQGISVNITPSIFRVITRPAYFRRALHFDNAEKGGVRKRKGGTMTPFNQRLGDKVLAEKAGKTYTGWVGGFTNAKTKNVSVYDHNWKRIGQFSPKKVQLIRRSNKLCVV